MALNIVFYGFGLFALVGLEHKCDAEVVHYATSAVDIYIENWFPKDFEFNESCVAEGCPELKNMSFCPGELDIDALRNITEAISKCMSGLICGIVIDPRPSGYVKVSLDQVLPGSKLKGNATFAAGAGYLSNVSNIHLQDMMSNQSQHLPLQLSMLMPNIRVYGQYEMEFRLETGFGPDLTARLTQPTYDIGIQFASICSINHTGPHLDIIFENPMVKVSPQLCGIDLPAGFPNIQSAFFVFVQTFYEKSTMASAIGRFLRKLFRSAIQITSDNCKSLNVTV